MKLEFARFDKQTLGGPLIFIGPVLELQVGTTMYGFFYMGVGDLNADPCCSHT